MNDHKKILYITPIPPPQYGSAMSSKMCLEILKTETDFLVKNIRVNPTVSMHNVGQFSLKKTLDVFRVWSKTIYFSIIYKPDINYLVPATSGFALYRDASIAQIIHIFSKGRLIVHLRSRFIEDDFQKPIHSYLIKKLLKADTIILIGKELKDNLPKDTNQPIVLLPNAIEPHLSDNDFNIIMNQRELKKNNLNILFLSNMNIEKGWMKVLESIKILKNCDLDFICNFVGAWPSKTEEDMFNNFVTKNNLHELVQFHGPAYNEKKNEHLKEADILVFPTEYKLETFGRVIIEAMEYGIPVIANGIATIPSIIKHKTTGYILEKNEPEIISEYIYKLSSKTMRHSMGIEARKYFLEKYTIDHFKNKFIKIISEPTFNESDYNKINQNESIPHKIEHPH